jgi:hypothetical protein
VSAWATNGRAKSFVTGKQAGSMMDGSEDVNEENTMPATEPQRTPEELARPGAEAFDRHVRPKLRPEDDGKFVAVDVMTGDHEIDQDDYAAVTRLRARCPSANVWLARVGQPTAYKLRRHP